MNKSKSKLKSNSSLIPHPSSLKDDMQPPYQEAHEGLTSEEIGEQASGKEADEIQREILRGGESGEQADESDNAGSANSSETPQGREEAKNDLKDKENANG